MQLTLAQGYSLTTMLAVAAVAILLTAGFYYRAFRTLRARQWQMLLALRVVAILLVVMLLFRPVFSYQNELTEKPAVIFLLDTSSSMSIADDATGVTRFNQARGKLVKWCEKLKDDFRLLPIAFAEQAEVLDGPQELPALAPTGKATSLLRALSAASKQLPPRDVAAVILLSDGIHNSAGSPLDITGKLGMVVHSVGVGASLRSNASYRDIMVTGMDCPDRMILKNVARVTGSIDAVGLGGRVVQVFLDEDGKQIGQAELTLDDVEGSQQVTFEFRPTIKGRHTYTVRVPPAGEEKIVENNQRSVVATVVEAGMHVLYIEGTLRAEYGALVDRFLAKDPDLEFYALVQTRPNVFLRRTNMTDLKFSVIPTDQETINKFDVFIFGDIDSSFIRPQQQEMFVKRVREGAGLVMLGGYHSLGPGGYGGTPLGEVLPVVLGGRQIGQITDPFLPSLTPDGVHHPIFANIAGFFPTPQGPPKILGLPSLAGCTRVERARPGASVLATYRGRIGPDARAGRAAAGPGTYRRLRRRHHGQVVSGDAGAEPGVALPAVLGANGPLARRTGRQCRDPGQHHRHHRQGVLRAGRANPHFRHRPRQGRPGRQQRQSCGQRSRANRQARTGDAHHRRRSGRALRRGDRAAIGRRLRSGGRGPPRRVEPEIGQDSVGSRPAQLGVRETGPRREDAGAHRGRYRRPLRPPLDRRPSYRPARPHPAQTDRVHRAAALLAARFLGAVRGGADHGMDTKTKIPTQIGSNSRRALQRSV